MFALWLALACSGGEAPEPPAEAAPTEAAAEAAPEAAAEAAPEAAAPADDSAAILAKADAADGTEDHVVSKCTGCRLGMDGDAMHTVQHEGYELHFCSAGCKESFESDPAGGLAVLNG